MKKIILGLGLAVPAIASADMGSGYSQEGMMYGGGHMWGWGGGAMGWLGGVVMVLVIVFLVLGIIYFWQEINKKRK